MALMKSTLAALLLIVAGCTGSSQPPESPLSGPPGCDEKAYAALVGSEVAELVLACSQFKSLDDCPTVTKKPIQDKYQEKFDKWRGCDEDGGAP